MGKKFALEDYEAIAKWWAGEIDDLHGQQFNLYQRIDFAGNLMAKYGPGKATTDKLVKHYKALGEPYDKRQALRDQDAAASLHNQLKRDQKEMHKLFAIHKLQKAIKQISLLEDHYKSAMALSKLLKEYRETIGYDKQDIDLPDFSDMGGNQYVLTTAPEDAGFDEVVIDEELKQKYAVPKGQETTKDIDHQELNG